MNRRLIGGAVAVLVATALAACSSDAGSGSSSSTSAKNQITIGQLAALTGSLSVVGKPVNEGLELAIKHINSSGYLKSVDASLKLDTQDDASDPTTGVTLFNQFAANGVPAVIESGASSVSLAVDPIANARKVVLIGNSASGTPADDYEFHTYDINTQFTKLGGYLVQKGGPRVAVFVQDFNPAYGVIAKNLSAAVVAAGGKIVTSQSVPKDATDFSTIITNIRATKPDVVFISALADTAGNLIAQMQKLGGLDGVLLASQSGVDKTVFDIAGDAATHLVMRPAWAPTSVAQLSKSPYDNVIRDTNTAFGYQLGWVVAIAIKQTLAAGDPVTGDAIRKRIPAASTSQDLATNGVIPDLVIKADGSSTWPGVLATFDKSGNIIAIKE